MWGNLDESVQDNAGGFLDESRATGGDGNKDTKRSRNIVPVVIKQLTGSTGDLKIGETVVRMVTFVARVVHVEQATTKATYELQDDTGKVTGYVWLEAGKTTSEPSLNINEYARVYGQLREHDGKNTVLITKIWPMTDLNELTNHLLEVLYVCLRLQGQSTNKLEITNAPLRMDTDDMSMRDETTLGLAKEQLIVLKVIQSHDSENGIERDVVKAKVPKNILPQVDAILDFLISEGHIYTALSDDHFKTT